MSFSKLLIRVKYEGIILRLKASAVIGWKIEGRGKLRPHYHLRCVALFSLMIMRCQRMDERPNLLIKVVKLNTKDLLKMSISSLSKIMLLHHIDLNNKLKGNHLKIFVGYIRSNINIRYFCYFVFVDLQQKRHIIWLANQYFKINTSES